MVGESEDPESVCEEEPTKSDDVVVETVIDKEEDRQFSNLGEFSENRVLKNSSFAKDEKTKKSTESKSEINQATDLEETEHQKEVIEREIEKETQMAPFSATSRSVHGGGHDPFDIFRSFFGSASPFSQVVESRSESVGGSGSVSQSFAREEKMNTESVRTSAAEYGFVGKSNAEKEGEGASGFSVFAFSVRSTDFMFCVVWKKREMEPLLRDSLGMLSEKMHETCAKMQETGAVKLMRDDVVVEILNEEKGSAMRKKSEICCFSDRRKGRRGAASVCVARENRASGIRKLGQGWVKEFDLMGLAQFDEINGPNSRGKVLVNLMDSAVSDITLGQSGVVMGQAQCLQRSE